MPRVRQFPYLLATDEHINVHSWENRDLHGDLHPLSDVLADWDPATPVQFITTINIDTPGVKSDCRLKGEALLRLALVWRCPGTGLRGRGNVFDLEQSTGRRSVSLSLRVDGAYLADRISVAVQLLLIRGDAIKRQLAPGRSGNLLWSEERTILLEGQAARFPTELKDFSKSGWLPARAAWFLDWSPEDLHQLVLSDMRLFINSANEPVYQTASGTGNEDSHRVLREAIRYDVARIMIEGALENEEFLTSPDSFGEGSVGSAIRRLIRTLFSNYDILALSQYCRHRRFRFELELQDRLRLFSEV